MCGVCCTGKRCKLAALALALALALARYTQEKRSATYYSTHKMRRDVRLILSVLCTCVSHLVACPYIAHNAWRYHSKRKHPSIYNRGYEYVLAAAVISLIIVGIQLPLTLWIASYTNMQSRTQVTRIMQSSIEMSFAMLAVSMIARMHRIHYHLHWTVASSNNKWKQHIDTSLKSKDPNWFIQNIKTFGNSQWTNRYVWLPYLVIRCLLPMYVCVKCTC